MHVSYGTRRCTSTVTLRQTLCGCRGDGPDSRKKSGCDENIHTERAIATPGIEAVAHDVSTAALVAHTDVSAGVELTEAEAPDFKFPSRGLPRAGQGLEPRALVPVGPRFATYHRDGPRATP